ncbi:hypothetical protein AB0J47_08820 [Nocardia sp. NPDC049737]|uniref:hypothetical protein n=1 Tax=Nocardia sp. NPDC049737 TaxID=3154358 RepID=UPI0034410226
MDEAASTLASRSTHLFDVVRRPDGREFSNEEIATAIVRNQGVTLSGSYVWYSDVINCFERWERLPGGPSGAR